MTKETSKTAKLLNTTAIPSKLAEYELVSEAVYARATGQSVSTVQKARLTKTGANYIKIGKSVRYRVSDIIRFIEENTVCPASQKAGA